MTAESIMRDERTVAIENRSYRLAYLLLSFGLLISTAWRGFVLKESSWDLLALVIAGGAVTSIYQGREQVLTRRWTIVSAVAVTIAFVLGAVLLLLRRT